MKRKDMHQFLEKIELGIKHLAFAIQTGLNLPVSVAKRYNDSHIGSNTIFFTCGRPRKHHLSYFWYAQNIVSGSALMSTVSSKSEVSLFPLSLIMRVFVLKCFLAIYRTSPSMISAAVTQLTT